MTIRVLIALSFSALLSAPTTAKADPPVQVGCRRAKALQRAIKQANTAGTGVIQLRPNCVYKVTTPSTATDAFPIITGDITIMGGDGTVIARDSAAAIFRVFEVAVGGTLTLQNVQVHNGSTAGLGGGVQCAGTVSLQEVTFINNTAGNGGAVSIAAGAVGRVNGGGYYLNTTTGVGGGAFINSGSLRIANALVYGNTAPINGGGLNTQGSGVTTIVDSTFEHNKSGSIGGAIANLGRTNVKRTTVDLNKGSSGGGIATGNTHVHLVDSSIVQNDPNNCHPLNTIVGCVD